ncbi:hypothetical protein NKI48_03050 [Mesorhizobium sp. M0644]|uniref:hypothetical protein n=1 Tax=Mesorhizobium sp. M0644 TaxID=2956979 RepID=UPI00333D1F7C
MIRKKHIAAVGDNSRITRAGLADEIDTIDASIKDLNGSKSDAYKAYREQLEDTGMDGRRAAAEVAAVKAAVAKRRKLAADPEAVAEKDDLIDAILAEIMAKPSRAREGSQKYPRAVATKPADGGANITMTHTNIKAEVPHDPTTGEILDEPATATIPSQTKADLAAQSGDQSAALIQERPSIDDEASPEAGPQAEASLVGTDTGTLADREGRSEGEAAFVDLPAISEIAPDPRLPVGSDGDPSIPSPEAGGAKMEERANAQPDRAAPAVSQDANSGQAVTISDADVPAFLKPAAVQKKSIAELRPHCQNPSNCLGYGNIHCTRCREDHGEAKATVNPHCQKPATCRWAHSQALCSTCQNDAARRIAS